MTPLLLATTALIAVAAAVRSTWSPCGLSMLSTITPLGEAARGTRYRTTATWFVLGAIVGGASLGALAALLALGVGALHLSAEATTTVAVAATSLAVLSDTGALGIRLPVHHRQVNERWLDQYRPWVYGGGFGWQIGAGVATYITTAAVYLVVVLAALSGRPAAALAIGVLFGLVRGLAVLLGRRLTSTEAILTFHRRFFAAALPAGWAVVAVEAVSVVAWLVTTPTVAGVAVAAATGTVVLVTYGLLPSRVLGLARPDASARRPASVAGQVLGR